MYQQTAGKQLSKTLAASYLMRWIIDSDSVHDLSDFQDIHNMKPEHLRDRLVSLFWVGDEVCSGAQMASETNVLKGCQSVYRM